MASASFAVTDRTAKVSGCTPRQTFWRVELPLALPEIMLGINQTVLLARSMIIICAMIGTRDLGQEVFIALAKADAGRGITAALRSLSSASWPTGSCAHWRPGPDRKFIDQRLLTAMFDQAMAATTTQSTTSPIGEALAELRAA